VHPDTKDIMDVDSFCANVVQAMGHEAGQDGVANLSILQCLLPLLFTIDHVEIEALCRALQLNVDVAYLNGVRADGVDFIKFHNESDTGAAPITLLYR